MRFSPASLHALATAGKPAIHTHSHTHLPLHNTSDRGPFGQSACQSACLRLSERCWSTALDDISSGEIHGDERQGEKNGKGKKIEEKREREREKKGVAKEGERTDREKHQRLRIVPFFSSIPFFPHLYPGRHGN